MATDPKTRETTEDQYLELDILNSSEQYEKGKELLYRNGFLIIPDSSGKYAYHKVYTLHTPAIDDDEILYPDNFLVWKELATDEERSHLMSVINDWLMMGETYKELFKFWVPFIKPNKNKNSPIYMYTELLLSEMALAQKRNSGKPVNLYQTPNPVVSSKMMDRGEQKSLAPIKWIPRLEWFPDKVKALSIYDILTIYPKVEAELLSLIIGRAVVGRSNHLPPGYDAPIIHTSRMAAFVIGEDPGLGKTTLFTALFNALETVGYRLETFDSFSNKFNLGGVVTADIVYKDDMTDKEFKSLTESGVAKSLISGSGVIKVQDKGVDAYNVFPIATLFANFNNFNPRLAFGIDPGFAERSKLISTIREAELEDLEVSELSQGSDDYRPFVHLDYLAEKLQVSKKTMLLYFARLCADKFLETLETREGLETKVDFLSQRLRIPFNKDSTSQILTFFLYCACAAESTEGRVATILKQDITTINPFDWDKLLNDGLDVLKVWYYNPHLLKEFVANYETKYPQDNLHPYHGFKILDRNSLKYWVENKGADYSHLIKSDSLLYLKEAFKVLRQTSGLPFTHDEVWLVKAWERVKYYVRQIPQIADETAKEYKEIIIRIRKF